MKRLFARDIVLKVLGLLLLTAAVLTSCELLTVPVANKDLGSWRTTVSWFRLFSMIALYKGVSGAESGGGFGSVHANRAVSYHHHVRADVFLKGGGAPGDA